MSNVFFKPLSKTWKLMKSKFVAMYKTKAKLTQTSKSLKDGIWLDKCDPFLLEEKRKELTFLRSSGSNQIT